MTWEELGLTNGNPTGTSELFYSADGIDFERIDSPFGVMSRFSAFEAIDGGFLVVEQDNQTGASTVWTSTDGRAWTQLPGGPAISWITAVGAIPNGLAIVGDAYTGDRNLTVLSTTTDRGVHMDVDRRSPPGRIRRTVHERCRRGRVRGDRRHQHLDLQTRRPSMRRDHSKRFSTSRGITKHGP